MASLVAVLLSGVAVALSATRFATRRFDASALLRCLGLSRRETMVLFSLQLTVLGLLASLGGALLGYTIPLAKAVSQSESMADMLVWSGVALIAQLVAYGISRLILPTLSADVDNGKVASGIFMAAMSVSIGLLNAAAMTQ